MERKKILYIGGFRLPDKNAAALRVISNAKALKKIGYEVVFFSAVEEGILDTREVQYEGITCFEYKKEPLNQYLLSCSKVVKIIEKIKVSIVIAYNYPAIALNSLRKYCKKRGIKCIADVTEWYIPQGNFLYRVIKGFDSEFRMRYVHPRLDGIIAISEYLYDYYKDKVKTVNIPPLVDVSEEKWSLTIDKKDDSIRFIYAGTPSAQKERLDLIVGAIEGSNANKDVHLDIVGITEEEYNNMYKVRYKGERTTFWGRISNRDVIKLTKQANWAIILRDNNKVVKAGFPTKLVESITCGTPVIINRFSNVEDYLDDKNCIFIKDFHCIEDAIRESTYKDCSVNTEVFHYANFCSFFEELFLERSL